MDRSLRRGLTCYDDGHCQYDTKCIILLSEEQTDHCAAQQQEDQRLLDLVYELGQSAWRLAGCELIVAPYCLAMSQRSPREAIANEGDGCGCGRGVVLPTPVDSRRGVLPPPVEGRGALLPAHSTEVRI